MLRVPLDFRSDRAGLHEAPIRSEDRKLGCSKHKRRKQSAGCTPHVPAQAVRQSILIKVRCAHLRRGEVCAIDRRALREAAGRAAQPVAPHVALGADADKAVESISHLERHVRLTAVVVVRLRQGDGAALRT
eukprot:4532098-Pleurochrysis_carterae.AAC.6